MSKTTAEVLDEVRILISNWITYDAEEVPVLSERIMKAKELIEAHYREMPEG